MPSKTYQIRDLATFTVVGGFPPTLLGIPERKNRQNRPDKEDSEGFQRHSVLPILNNPSLVRAIRPDITCNHWEVTGTSVPDSVEIWGNYCANGIEAYEGLQSGKKIGNFLGMPNYPISSFGSGQYSRGRGKRGRTEGNADCPPNILEILGERIGDVRKLIKHVHPAPSIPYARVFDAARFTDPGMLKEILVPQLDLQLKWHRLREFEMDKRTKIPLLSRLKKQQKAELIVAAVVRWKRRVDAGEVPLMGFQSSEPVEEDRVIVEPDNEEDDAGYGDRE
ncbi:hypothetical protein FB451DRAFT_1380375 [Mycena latifolia]|nr:hypothetical protein FB451DRAFT_1380375 [Mycena latifolia]